MSDFIEKFNKTSDFEEKLLQSLALFWKPIAANDIQKLLKVLGCRTPAGKIYPVQDVSLARNSLINKGLLNHFKESWGSGYQIFDDKDKEFLTREIFKEDRFDEWIQTIQREFGLDTYQDWYWSRESKKFRIWRDYRLRIYQKKFGAM